jgi:hypothetical protein
MGRHRRLSDSGGHNDPADKGASTLVNAWQEFIEAKAKTKQEFARADVFRDYFSPLLPNWHTHMPAGDEWYAHGFILRLRLR